MLGHWRMVLRQAEEAARVGRFEEAFTLATRPDVADHHHAVQFRSRLALDLIARATRRGAVDDLNGAVEDLDLAERMGAAPDSLAAARLSLADRVVEEVRTDLDAGEPARALERIEDLARHKISGPALRRSKEIAEAWQSALAEGRRGEFGRAQEQLDRAERLAAGAGAVAAQQAVAAAKVELENRQKTSAPKVEALYTLLSEGKWPAILTAAEALMAIVPEHPAARQARTRAWQEIAAIGPSAGQLPGRGVRGAQAAMDNPRHPAGREPFGAGAEDKKPAGGPAAAAEGIVWLAGEESPQGVGTPLPSPERYARPVASPRVAPPARPMARVEAAGPKGRFLLWVDGVGGYLVCMDDRIVLGRAGPDSHADIPLMGDLSRNHATLLRNGEGYLLQAHQASFVNGKPVVDQVVLHDGDVIRLGPTVELEFRQPSPVSATARLSIVSRHRLPLAVDGVLLMAETCIIGEAAQAHIPAPALKEPIVLYRQAGALWCRAAGAFDVDSRTCAARAPLTLHSSVLGDGFSFSLEPLGSQNV
ncbi:MAG: FHA domain-containing protein [Isosphaeraceae bacterium]